MSEELDLSTISPGVRTEVKQLNDSGFTTCDSGDGSNVWDALPYRHVFGYIPDHITMEAGAVTLQDLYPMAHVEVSYSPDGPRLYMVFLDGDPEG